MIKTALIAEENDFDVPQNAPPRDVEQATEAPRTPQPVAVPAADDELPSDFAACLALMLELDARASRMPDGAERRALLKRHERINAHSRMLQNGPEPINPLPHLKGQRQWEVDSAKEELARALADVDQDAARLIAESILRKNAAEDAKKKAGKDEKRSPR